jgi:DNA-binding MarR family transcriptional regulator
VSHPTQGLKDVVHQRTRLGILAVSCEASKVDFGFLKQTLGLTDGNLSRHLQVLEQAGYVDIEKGYNGRRPRTWIRITRSGRKAFQLEMAVLRDLLDLLDGAHGGGDQPVHTLGRATLTSEADSV